MTEKVYNLKDGFNGKSLEVVERMTIKELEDKIVKMKEDKEAKCKAAKEQLIDMLKVTVDKYRTATGTAEALRIVRFTHEDIVNRMVDEEGKTVYFYTIQWANQLAREMAEVTESMVHKAEELPYNEMDQLCEGFYDQEFEVDDNILDAAYSLSKQMMCIDLCRNVGGAAEDMVSFIKRVQEEIDATGEELKKLKAEKKED